MSVEVALNYSVNGRTYYSVTGGDADEVIATYYRVKIRVESLEETTKPTVRAMPAATSYRRPLIQKRKTDHHPVNTGT